MGLVSLTLLMSSQPLMIALPLFLSYDRQDLFSEISHRLELGPSRKNEL